MERLIQEGSLRFLLVEDADDDNLDEGWETKFAFGKVSEPDGDALLRKAR
jgi:hypothetical protein